MFKLVYYSKIVCIIKYSQKIVHIFQEYHDFTKDSKSWYCYLELSEILEHQSIQIVKNGHIIAIIESI